jgi:hypothetical protein
LAPLAFHQANMAMQSEITHDLITDLDQALAGLV